MAVLSLYCERQRERWIPNRLSSSHEALAHIFTMSKESS